MPSATSVGRVALTVAAEVRHPAVLLGTPTMREQKDARIRRGRPLDEQADRQQWEDSSNLQHARSAFFLSSHMSRPRLT